MHKPNFFLDLFVVSMPKLRRVNSGGPSNIESESESTFQAGNLDNSRRTVNELLTDNDLESSDDDDSTLENQYSFETLLTLEDIRKVDKVLEDTYGIPIIQHLTMLLLKGILQPTHISVQSMAYQVVRLTRGVSGVRYHESYGMFWAAIRNLIKSSGLVPFMDHFMIPSALSKYKKKLLTLGGLSVDKLGKLGIQKENIQSWTSALLKEMKCEKLCLSVSMDGKKIHMSNDGVEDMGDEGTANMSDKSEQDLLIDMFNDGSRASLFSAYDHLSRLCQTVSSRLEAIERLLNRNKIAAEKNSLLSKYVYVLQEQLTKGSGVIQKIGKLQLSVLTLICSVRNTTYLLPHRDCVDLSLQANIRKLQKMTNVEDQENVNLIDSLTTEKLTSFPWVNCNLSRPFSKIHSDSYSYTHLENTCILGSEEIFLASGMGKSSPLRDMKKIYMRCNSQLDYDFNCNPSVPKNIEATLSALIAPMIFGNNCYIAEAGIFIRHGYCSKPSFLIYDNSDNIKYAVRVVNKKVNPFVVDLDTAAMCLMDADLTESITGSLLIQFSDNYCVAFSIPTYTEISDEMITIVKTYVRASSIMNKRPKAMILRINSLRTELQNHLQRCSILGSFPIVTDVIMSQNFPSNLENFFQSSTTPSSISEVAVEVNKSRMADELKIMLDEKTDFISKKARELVIINVSDMSGIGSESLPHTQLCSSFLTSSSLKVVGKKCLDDSICFITRCNAEVLNIGVDGESIHLATKLSNGRPGTTLALAKHIMSLLKSVNKEFFVKSMSRIKNLRLDMEYDDDEEEDDVERLAQNIIAEEVVDEHISSEVLELDESEYDLSIDDIDEWLSQDALPVEDEVKVKKLKSLKIGQVRWLCLEYVFPLAKKYWLQKSLGRENLVIKFNDGSSSKYIPNSIFDKTESGYFRTITFDAAHLR